MEQVWTFFRMKVSSALYPHCSDFRYNDKRDTTCEEHTIVRTLYGLLSLINESLNPVGVALKA
jgi:hypothetical protein